MKTKIALGIGLLIHALCANSMSVDTLYFNTFGKVTIYQPVKSPDSFVLFISGDGGWNEGVLDMAKNISDQGAVVAGIDITHYYRMIRSEKVKCYYPAGDFENLSLTIQKKLKFEKYLKPVLIGYSSGATLAYGILAQAPANTFKGAISLGFCPDIEINKPLCNGSGLKSHVLQEGKSYYLEASALLTAPFIVLQGMIDKVCFYNDTKKYMENMPFAELVSLQNVGHGFSVTRNWLPQMITAYKKILKEPDYVARKNSQNALLQSQHLEPLKSDLPLTLIPSSSNDNLPVVFFVSGDGGWTSFDHAVSEKLAEKGMPVIGLDAQKYFWKEKQPRETAAAIADAVAYYMKQWHRSSFVLVGYSFGACVVPFIASNISPQLKDQLKGVFCLSPDETGDFEIHIADMLEFDNNGKYDVLKELRLITSLNPVCIFGDEEDEKVRGHFSATGIKVETLTGNHHYNNDFGSVAAIISRDFNRTDLEKAQKPAK